MRVGSCTGGGEGGSRTLCLNSSSVRYANWFRANVTSLCVCRTYKISIGQSVKNMSGSPFFVEDVELLNFSLVGEKHFFSTAGCSFDDTPAACVKNRPI